MRSTCLLVAACAWALGVGAAPKKTEARWPEPVLRLPKIAAAPVIDGTVGEAEWRSAFRDEHYCTYRTRNALGAGAVLYLARDGENVYFASVCETAPRGIVRAVKPRASSNNKTFWDDCYEFDFIRDVASRKPTIFHLMLNANGAHYSAGMVDGTNVAWDGGDWRTASTVKDGYWHFEMSVPLASVKFDPADGADTVRGIRIARNWRLIDPACAHQTSYTADDGAFMVVSGTPRVVFDDAAPTVRVRYPKDGGEDSYAVEVELASATERAYAVSVTGRPVNSQPAMKTETLRPAPGRPAKFALKGPVLGEEDVDCDIRVTSEDGRTVHYSRRVVFKRNPPPVKWLEGANDAGKTDVNFAYYPSYDTIHSAATLKGTNLAVRLAVRTAAGREIAATNLTTDAKGAFESFWRIPDLTPVTRAEGKPDYEFVMSVPALKDGTVVKKFRRFDQTEWENNAIGTSKEAIPPFTPLRRESVGQGSEVRGQTAGEKKVGEGVGAGVGGGVGVGVGGAAGCRTYVGEASCLPTELEKISVVLRDHIVDKKTGLWQQVTAAGKELLARPMALVDAKSVRVPVDAVAHRVDMEEKDPLLTRRASASTGGRGKDSASTGGRGKDSASTGRGEATASTEWDYDGMMEWKLTLAAGHYEPFALEIPMKAAEARLMHACVDCLRKNYAGAVPAGTGRVWDGTKAGGRNAIIGDYVPYIWIGGPLRGIAVFGENDKGWVLGGEQKVGGESRSTEEGKVPLSTSTSSLLSYSRPCQEIIREADGTVVLRLNLVQVPCDISEPQTIRIGFQATPVKPMLDGWRAMSRGRFIGGCHYWGGTGADLEPFDSTTEFWEKMAEARRTGKVDKAYLADALRRAPYDGEPGTAKRARSEDKLRRHYNSGMNVAAGDFTRRERMTWYTNARGVVFGLPSGDTYCDEWSRWEWMDMPRVFTRYSKRDYDLDPVKSFRDYAAFWYRRMVTSGACDALYWDDIYLSANFDLVGTDAYRMPDGEIQPATGVFNMRALVKRCAVTLHEAGKDPRHNWIHMTNTAMAPISAFAGIHYDWEDTAGDLDFQERYTRDYLLACSVGRQFGVRVGVMGYFATKDPNSEKYRELERGGTGVCLTHELEWGRMKLWREKRELLNAWGYTNATTRVYNWWDEDVRYPVAISGIESTSIAMAKPGEAIIVASDWGKGGVATIRPDCATLGIPNDFRAFDFETGAELNVTDGAVDVTIGKHDFAIVRLTE